MTTLESGMTGIRSILGFVSGFWGRVGMWMNAWMPKRLYARSLLIIVLPMVILQSVVAFVFMERHYNLVTRRLSASVTQDVAALIDIYQKYPQDKDAALLRQIATERLNLRVDFLPGEQLPPPAPKPFFSILDQVLSQEIATGSSARSGSTRSAIPTSSKSASSSTATPCRCSPRAIRPTLRTRTSSSSGWSAPRWC